MAPMPHTPRRSRKTTRPRSGGDSISITNSPSAASPLGIKSEPPHKKRRYVPGGPGGGGRYVDEDGNEEPVGGTGPGGYNYIGPRGRVGQENARKGVMPVVYPGASGVRRERGNSSAARSGGRSARTPRTDRTRTVLPRNQQPKMRFNSSAQAAAAVVQNDGYKPREERSWEEFHPDLDIDLRLRTYGAKEVDGVVEEEEPETKEEPGEGSHTPTSMGAITPGAPGALVTPGTPPTKRRPGRPPRDPVAFYAARAAAQSVGFAASPMGSMIAPLQNQNPKERLTLPQPSYRKVDALAKFEDKAAGQVKYVEKSMANVGYQETDIFIRSEHIMIKHNDAYLDEDLDLPVKGGEVAVTGGSVGRVEYDMDEQDDKWLEAFNQTQRKAAGIEPISREMFEITITKIEKEWHALEKRIPKPNPKPPQTHRPRSSSAAAVNGEPQAGEELDSKCAICDDGDCENTNAIVFCDGCDLAVHQECYGVPFIPEGQWLCRKCQLIGRGVPTCIFCPNTEGGFKQTNSSRWAHLLCAMWIPEVSLGNHTFMEPVMDVEKVPKTRWKLTCYICQQRMGACIQCGNKLCYQAFHVTCARRAHLFLKMKNNHGTLAELDGTTQLKAFCDKHCPQDYAKENDVAKATREARSFYKRTMRDRLWADSQASALALAATHQNATTEHPADESQKTGAHLAITLGSAKKKGELQNPKSVWKLPSGAPVIPSAVYDIVDASLQRFTILRRREWVAAACRYWTLKREARRGAALLKRLQLQMETFSSMELTRRNFASMGDVGRARLERRIEFAKMLVRDVEKLKELSTHVVMRETEKVQYAVKQRETLDITYFPITKLLPPIVDKALALDIKRTFTAGLWQVQNRLHRRYYVQATTLAEDIAVICKKGIEAVAATLPSEATVGSAEYNSLLKVAIHEVKDRKKLAKRIIKAIQPQLEIAVRAEADLLQKSPDKMVADLELVLEGCIDISPEALLGPTRHGTADPTVAVQSIEGADTAADDNVDVNQQISVEAEAADSIAQAEATDIDMVDEDAPGEIDDGDAFPSIAVAEPEAGEDSPTKPAAQEPAAAQSTDTPPGATDYPAPAHNLPQPPTPPVSNPGAGSIVSQDLAPTSGVASVAPPGSFLTGGGKPWYLENYDPKTRTFEEPPPAVEEAGAGEVEVEVEVEEEVEEDVGRATSDEELSEIDDEEMRDLEEGMDVEMAGVGEKKVEKSTPKKGKAKKRRRAY
ncbi:hypothetical protein V492_03044 [Pseudogymnoascus sp. VKM F-4246]|nr:hypothetical protein V492_03044 [Pseudogymnoascus sp. VKM F-4246]